MRIALLIFTFVFLVLSIEGFRFRNGRFRGFRRGMFGRRFLGGRRGGLSGYGRGGRRGTGTFPITKGNETPKPILKGTNDLNIGVFSSGDRGGNRKTRAEQLGIDVGSSRKSGYRDFGNMLQNHAGQTPILIGIPYPVVYEIPARNYMGSRPRPIPKFERQQLMASTDYLDYPDTVSDDVFEGPAWMTQ